MRIMVVKWGAEGFRTTGANYFGEATAGNATAL